MMSRSKSLITLTDIDVQSNQPEIAISMTSGLHTLKAVTVNQNVWETIGFLACELATAPAEVRDRSVRGPVDLMQLFRFDIDPDLRLKMSNQYHEMGDCDLVRMNEDIINGFDEINGNNAVSQSMGIADLATLLSKEGQAQANTEIDKLFNRLCDMLTKLDPWDHGTQGTSVLDAVDEQTGTKVDLVVVHAVGNIYAEGTIGKFGIRIFKASNIQVYIGWGSDFPVRPEVFLLHEREKLIRRLHDAVGISANSPA